MLARSNHCATPAWSPRRAESSASATMAFRLFGLSASHPLEAGTGIVLFALAELEASKIHEYGEVVGLQLQGLLEMLACTGQLASRHVDTAGEVVRTGVIRPAGKELVRLLQCALAVALAQVSQDQQQLASVGTLLGSPACSRGA